MTRLKAWMRAAANATRLAWMQAGIALLILILIDGLATVFFHAPRETDPRAFADAYHGASWTPKYFDEYAAQRVRWQPYAYWVSSPYKGEYISINDAGLRNTWRGGGQPKCVHPARIFTFGGSTMWGEGAPDDETVASWIQRQLAAKGRCVEVTNMGQDGYVSTQEVLLLAEQIRRGNLPDLVIFYDGYNDVFAAEDNAAAGLTYNEVTRAKEFNLLNYSRPLFKAAALRFLLDTGIGGLAMRLIVAMAPSSYYESQGRLVSVGAAKVKSAKLATDVPLQDNIARVYLLNKQFADSMAAKFGFRSLTYWQPCVLNKNQLSAYEKTQADGFYPGEKELYESVHRRIAAAGAKAGINDLSNVFHDMPQPYFIDAAHLTGAANEIIAKAMLDDVIAALPDTIRAPANANQPQPSSPVSH